MLQAFEVDKNREFCNCGNLMKFESTFEYRKQDDGSPDYNIEIFKTFKCLACREVIPIS